MNDNIKIRNVFREVFDDDEMIILDSTSSKDIEDWDSVAHIKLVLSLEQEFSIRLTIDEVASIKTVDDFKQSISRHLESVG